MDQIVTVLFSLGAFFGGLAVLVLSLGLIGVASLGAWMVVIFLRGEY
jgi:hypothetical protein